MGLLIAIAVLLVGVQLSAQDAQQDKQRQDENQKIAAQLPDGAGKTILVDRCGVCHGLGRVAAGRKSLKSWTNTLKVMVINGAILDSKETEALARYLSENFPEAVNVNSATAEELAKVPAIDPPLATSIVAYREKHGPFTKIDDLAAVDGVTSEILRKISSRLTLGVRAATPGNR